MDSLFGGIYREKNILITGHTGFKGSWLSLWLSLLGAHVVGYSADIPTDPNHFELVKPAMKSIVGDVLDKKKLFETIEMHRPDIIFHMAAQPIVRLSYLDPVKTIETNIIGTMNVLEACRQNQHVQAIVSVTSDKCYKNQEIARGYKESDPMGGDDPYSASKGAADLIIASYRHSFFHPDAYGKTHDTLLGTVRAGNVIGGGDWAKDRLIPDIMRATSKGEVVTIRSPRATRPWQHVLDPLSGYLHLGWRLLKGEKEFANAWNFGPSEALSIPVGIVIEQAKRYWGGIEYEIDENAANLHETNLLTLDSTKARTRLPWKSVWGHAETLERTVHWYKEYYTNGKILTEEDLRAYIEDAKRASAEWAMT